MLLWLLRRTPCLPLLLLPLLWRRLGRNPRLLLLLLLILLLPWLPLLLLLPKGGVSRR